MQELRRRRDERHGRLRLRQPHDGVRTCSSPPVGVFEYEAAHGTVQKRYYPYLKARKDLDESRRPHSSPGPERSPIGAELDTTPAFAAFSKKLEDETLGLIEDGVMTGDLARLATPFAKETLDSWKFIERHIRLTVSRKAFLTGSLRGFDAAKRKPKAAILFFPEGNTPHSRRTLSPDGVRAFASRFQV